MKRNFEDDHVVMAVEVYEKLKDAAADLLHSSEISKIERHVRKFNRVQRDKHIENMHMEMLEKREAIRKAKSFFSQNAGKIGCAVGRLVKVCEVYKMDKSMVVVEFLHHKPKIKVPVSPEKITILNIK
ncbi:hypothetical protein [Pseudomonas aeruginosa]|uniref:hypothetical protein n=1 Tax=Pseudomonas aeruginosa TaxID=287 RepID=UPI001CA58ED5|nr:hypothetical protein [Pseudomonas aeruginosa]MBW6070367.1 hypothetical protein [Pseudomonas aeruginosa]